MLDISRNNFTVFPQVLCQCSQLVSLSISHNSMVTLPDCMKELRNLMFLEGIGCQFAESPPVISKMKNLFTVGIVKNTISSIGSPSKPNNKSPRKIKKRVSVEMMRVPIVYTPAIPITAQEEEDLISFIKHRAAARSAKSGINTGK